MRRIALRVGGFLGHVVRAAIPYLTFVALVLAVVLYLRVLTNIWVTEPQAYIAIASIIASLGVGTGLLYFARSQFRHALTMRMLEMMPVLTPWYAEALSGSPSVVMLDNCGRGPAMDIRAYVFRPGPGPGDAPKLVGKAWGENLRSHLGPQDGELRFTAAACSVPNAAEILLDQRGIAWSDVWVIHCGDLNGNHWHAWCNLTRDGIPRRGEPFIFESEERTPGWVAEHCPRCSEIRGLRSR
jgi:hypothetical protein